LLFDGVLEPDLDRDNGLVTINVFLIFTVPILTSDYIFVQNSCNWVGKLQGLRLENLIVRILDLDVLLLDGCFHSFMVFEVKTFLSNRLQICYKSVGITLSV
jgi:hypothetical protein